MRGWWGGGRRGLTARAADVDGRDPFGRRPCPSRLTDRLRLERGHAGGRAGGGAPLRRTRAGGGRREAPFAAASAGAPAAAFCRSRRCAVLERRPRRLRRAGGGFLASGPPPERDPTRRGGGGASTASARHTDARGSGVAGDGVRVGKGCAIKAAEPVGEPSPLEAGDAAGDDSGGKVGGRGELASSVGGASL